MPYSFSSFPQIFVRYLPKWSTPRYLKSEALQVPPKVRTVLVWYLLLSIRISVYSCTGCGTSKIYLYLEDSRSSFSRVSLKSESKDARPETAILFCLQRIRFSKQKFDVKQLKMNKFINSLWQLIISNSNDTL